MAITASYHPHTLIFKKPAGTSRGYLHHKKIYYVCLTNRANPTQHGVGECAPWPGLSIDDRPDYESKLQQVVDALNVGTPVTNIDLKTWPSLQFGLEMAQRDLQTGGQQRWFDTPFTQGKTKIPNHALIWLGATTDVLAQIDRKLAAGATLLKLKIGALNFATELEILRVIRAAHPPARVRIRLDANGAFTPATSAGKLAALAPFGIEALEQPLKPGQPEALADLIAHSPIPIALDEELLGHHTSAARRRLLKHLKPHAIVLKPTLLGGFAAADDWIAAASSAGIKWWANSALESNVGLTALCQWVAHHNPVQVQGLGSGTLYRNNLAGPIQANAATVRYRADRTLALEGLCRT